MIYHHVSALAKVEGMKEILLIGFFENSIFDRFLSDVQLEFPSVSIKYKFKRPRVFLLKKH
jgi:mannose-1-phosphate guanylyltransferase